MILTNNNEIVNTATHLVENNSVENNTEGRLSMFTGGAAANATASVAGTQENNIDPHDQVHHELSTGNR